MSPIKLVLFDITGTILKDTGNLARAFAVALGKHGITATEDELKEWRGAEKSEIVRHFVGRSLGRPVAAGDAEAKQIYREFLEALEAEFITHPVETIDGAEAAFIGLRQQGILLGTTTGYHRKLTDIVLERAGWRDMFHTTVCSDEVALGRPAPYMIFRAMEEARVLSVGEVAVVGDTPLDLRAGANAGVRAIVGVLSGAHSAERLQREPHTLILPSVAELPDAMRGLEVD